MRILSFLLISGLALCGGAARGDGSSLGGTGATAAGPALPVGAGTLKSHVDFAYRDANSLDKHLVAVQGDRNGAFKFEDSCKEGEAACECRLFRDTSDTKPVIGDNPRPSAMFNAFFCTIPSMENPDAFKFVEVRDGKHKPLTAVEPVATTMGFRPFFRRLTPDKVRGIFRYTIERSFFVGEGVEETSIICAYGQRLGVISATYSYYLYKGLGALNQNAPASNELFPGDICQRTDLYKVKVNPAPELKLGLYQEKDGPFQIEIRLTHGPSDTQPVPDIYGWAGIPDSSGNCLPGLRKAWAWVAKPKSVLPKKEGSTVNSSSFVNSAGNLNETTIDVMEPAPFIVYRWPNVVPCDSVTGSCKDAKFGNPVEDQRVKYEPLLPNICVIPKEMLQTNH